MRSTAVKEFEVEEGTREGGYYAIEVFGYVLGDVFRHQIARYVAPTMSGARLAFRKAGYKYSGDHSAFND
jgi:hypothetical protein